MITKGQAVYYKNEGGGIRVGFAIEDEHGGSVKIDFPGYGQEVVPTYRCFESAKEAHASQR